MGNDVYTPIYSWRDLQLIKDNLTDKYQLQNDIAFPTVGQYGFAKFSPIAGTGDDDASRTKFTGVLDGNGKKITGLFISEEARDFVGLLAI